MAVDKKISELTETVSLTDIDWFTILDQSALPPDGNNAKVLASNVRNYMSYLSQGQATDLTDSGETSLHYHDSDRSNANETLTFSGSNPKIDTATATQFLFALTGSSSFGFFTSIGGHDLINFRIIDPLKTLTSLTYSAPLVTATTSTPHGLPAGSSNNAIIIAGASPSEYNGTYTVTETGANTFTYTPGSPPGSSPASPPGSWRYVPICFIIGTGLPTAYSGLLDNISFGSVFLKFNSTPTNTAHIFTKGESIAGVPQWRTLSSSAT
jgi:hypothetical protein